MKKQRFMLTYSGSEAMPPGDAAQLHERVFVVQQSHQSLLVKAIPKHLSRLLRTMPQWRMWPEWAYNLLLRLGGFPAETNYVRLGLLVLATGLFLFLPISCRA